ncbi:MAG TPA: TetR/AcrR family transcriptional regulator [Mycobacteriales bacterium]|nr:TetR/AcrR family transcriptional regulator [Mycobacteriales bacterium]
MPNRSADPAKLVALLWAPSTAVGRTGITVGAVVEAAIRIADSEGLDALSMRRLAGEVGVGAMTLYGYVPGRAELLQLMLDAIAGQTYRDRPLPRSRRSLRTAVRYIADRNWDRAMAHPWSVEIPPGRPIVGPGESLKYEHELEPLDGIGLSDRDMDALLATVLSMVGAAARWHLSLQSSRASLTDDQWWSATAPVLGRAMQDVSLPIASRVGTTVASAGDPYATLQFGLTAVVDAVSSRLG